MQLFFRKKKDEHNIWKGLVAGMAGGLAASFVMNQFQSVLSKISRAGEQQNKQQQDKQKPGEKQQAREETPATAKAASAISEDVFDHRLTKGEKKKAGPAVHYAFGSLMGGAYGAITEVAPVVSTGAGLPFGTAVWLGADEIAVPALGLSKAPTEYPLSKHASALAAHFVYGLTTEAVRHLVRQRL